MNRVLLIALAIFLGGFLVCMVITVPLITWALREEDRENGVTQERPTKAKDIAAILVAAIVLSLAWVLILPLYVLMLAEKITGRGEDD